MVVTWQLFAKLGVGPKRRLRPLPGDALDVWIWAAHRKSASEFGKAHVAELATARLLVADFEHCEPPIG